MQILVIFNDQNIWMLMNHEREMVGSFTTISIPV